MRSPAYSFGEAARLVRVPVSTARAWLLGQGPPERRFEPVLTMDDPERRYLSFRNLVELHVLAAIRKQYGVSLQNVRRAVTFLQERMRDEHPLATRRMLTDGRDLLVREGGRLLNASRSGQLEMDIVSAFLERIEFGRRGEPVRFYPFTTSDLADAPRSIVVDPRVQFGRPCLRDQGVPTEVISERFLAGEPVDTIAGDYEVDRELIEGAIRFEKLRAA